MSARRDEAGTSGLAPASVLSTDRITRLRTVSNAHLLQLVDDLGPCEPWTRELANRVTEVDRLTRLVQRQADELSRFESLFGPLP